MTTKTKPHSKRTAKIVTALLLISAALFAIDYMEDGVVFAAPTVGVGAELVETGLNMNFVYLIAIIAVLLIVVIAVKWR
jgi:hypothetical protein